MKRKEEAGETLCYEECLREEENRLAWYVNESKEITEPEKMQQKLRVDEDIELAQFKTI